MHDGYLYTLGICGTAAGNNPAPALLNAMLKAIPPVKRAAMLGEVVLLANPHSFADPMLNEVLADMRDAELLFIVTPVMADRVPARLASLLARIPAHALAGTQCLLTLVGEPPGQSRAAERAIISLLAPTGVQLNQTLFAHAEEPFARFEAAAQQAYRQARALVPHALE
jgi:NAD(P)H-dependent FMN reductase